MGYEDLIRQWDGEQVAVRFDAPSGAWMFVGVHSTALGPGFGGVRMRVYHSPDDGLHDVLRLSSAMTSKNALAGLPFGGGKAVLAVPEIPQGEERRGLLLRYAEMIASLRGTYLTACDMNITEEDMDVIAERCPHVMGCSVSRGGSGSSGPATAFGVFNGIRASVAHAFGSDDLHGRSVLVQGAGDVGGPLVDLLDEAGADVLVADVHPDRSQAAAQRAGAREVAPDAVATTECDVYSPCATGAVLTEVSIPALCCKVVAGAANNQLGTPEDAERLRERGILYAPDYVVNAGGVLSLAGLEKLGWTREQLRERLRAIADTLTEVFTIAEKNDTSTETAAAALVRDRLASAH